MNLTASAFQAIFSNQIDELMKEGMLSSETVLDPGSSAIQARQADCGLNVSEFQSNVVSGILLDADVLKPEDIDALEQSFRRAYNRLTFLNCDSHRRTSK